MTLKELKALQNKLRKQVKGYATKADLSDDEKAKMATAVEQLDTVNSQIVVLKAIEADETSEAAVKAQAEKVKADAEAETALAARVDARVKAALDERDAAAIKAGRLPFNAGNAPALNQHTPKLRRYDHLTAGQTALAIELYKSRNFHVPADMYRSAAVKAFEDESPYIPPNHVGDIADHRSALKALGIPDGDAAVKANEAMFTTSTGFGEEWVELLNSNVLWPKIRLGNPVLEQMDRFSVEVPQGANGINWKLESTDPTWYLVTETTATTASGPDATIPSSRIGTGEKSLTVAKAGARVPISGELDEDSLIAIVPQVESQLVQSGANNLASMIIDGDTDTDGTTNINDIGGTPNGDEFFLVMNGLRKLGLVTNTANSKNLGTMTDQDFIDLLTLMGVAGENAYNAFGVVGFIVDPWVNWKILQFLSKKTKDVSSSPTQESGRLTSIWNYPVIVTHNINRSSRANTGFELKTNADGKIDLDTPGNNTKGTMLAVRWDQWRLGYKRRITIENTRYARADANEITALMRVGLAFRDAEAVAVGYGATV